MPHHKNLAIHPAPFKSSHLSIPPSPFSPRSPLTPKPRLQKYSHTTKTSTETASTPPPAPSSPLQWVWTCHACKSPYPLGATRRCLDDGHHFCAGTTVVKSWRNNGPKKRTKRYRACTSEFDYLGWKASGRWRRSQSAQHSISKPTKPLTLDTATTKAKAKNCWTNCDFPSQCRWGKQVGIHTPTPTRSEFPTSSSPFSSDTWPLNTPMTDMPTLADCFAAEDTVASEEHRTGTDADAGARALSRLLQTSVEQRRRIGLAPQSHVCGSTVDEAVDTKMCDVDIITTTPSPEHNGSCIDPSLLTSTDPTYTHMHMHTHTHTYTYTYPPPASTAPPPPPPSQVPTTIQRLKALLTNKTTSPRQLLLPPLADPLRKKYMGAGAPMMRAREQRFGKEVVGDVDEGLRVERVGRWGGGVVNV